MHQSRPLHNAHILCLLDTNDSSSEFTFLEDPFSNFKSFHMCINVTAANTMVHLNCKSRGWPDRGNSIGKLFLLSASKVIFEEALMQVKIYQDGCFVPANFPEQTWTVSVSFWVLIPSSSENAILSHPSELHPDAQSTLYLQGETHKVLM